VVNANQKAAQVAARLIQQGFEDYLSAFREVTLRAAERFPHRQWPEMQADALERLGLYAIFLDKLTVTLTDALGPQSADRHLWEQIKQMYARHTPASASPELARTFFNSATRRIFATVGVDAGIEFPSDDFNHPAPTADTPVFRAYQLQEPLEAAVHTIMADYGFSREVFEPQGSWQKVSATIRQALDASRQGGAALHLEMHREVFYRGQGAYLIGRLVNGAAAKGIVIALLHPAPGITVDAVLVDVTPIRILFSYTRSAFHVPARRPAATVQFLHSILESKPEAEIYSSIGFFKHGKTLLYRDLRQHTRECTADRFEISAGQRGMVMIVFDMANDDMVLKLIRDHFQKPKNTTRRKVMDQYDFVFKHYRVGRLIEAQPFEYLSFDICCSPMSCWMN